MAMWTPWGEKHTKASELQDIMWPFFLAIFSHIKQDELSKRGLFLNPNAQYINSSCLCHIINILFTKLCLSWSWPQSRLSHAMRPSARIIRAVNIKQLVLIASSVLFRDSIDLLLSYLTQTWHSISISWSRTLPFKLHQLLISKKLSQPSLWS